MEDNCSEVFCTVHGPVDDFQGRHELLKAIHSKFRSSSNSVTNKLALVGYGGLGKSEPVKKFVVEYRAGHESCYIVIKVVI